jgi:hypothetical protein
MVFCITLRKNRGYKVSIDSGITEDEFSELFNGEIRVN